MPGGSERVEEPASAQPSVVVLLALALSTFCGGLTMGALMPFLPAMARDLDVGVPLLGQAPALGNLVAAVTGLVIGPLSDRSGRHQTLVLGLLALVASGLGMALAQSFLMLVVAVLIGAPGRSIATPLAQAIAGSAFAESSRPRAVAWTQTGLSVSVTLGVPLLTTVESVFGWRVAMLTLSGLALLAAGLVRWAPIPADDHESPRADSEQLRARPRPTEILGAYRLLLAHRPTIGLIASTVVGNTAISALLTYAGAYLEEIHALSTPEVGWAFSLSGAGLIAGGIIGAQLTRRIRPRRLVLGLMVVRGLVIAAMLLVPPGLWSVGGLIATLLFVLLGLVDGVYLVSVVLALAAETPAGRGTTMVANGIATSLGAAIGSAVGGLLLAIGGYTLLAAFPPISTGAAALMIWRSGRARQRASG